MKEIERLNNEENIQNILKEEINLEDINNEEFFCPECGEVPEILDIHIENNKIKLKCKNCGIKERTIKEFLFLESTKKSNNEFIETSCGICKTKREKDNNEFYYCYDCQKDFCNICYETCKMSKHKAIKVIEKKNKCPNHPNNFTHFCIDCQENFCIEELEKEHINHETIEIKEFNVENYLEERKKIIERNKYLSDLVRFNRLILKTCEKFQDNYFYLENAIKLGKSIEEEKKRDSNDIEYNFDDINNDIDLYEKEIKQKIINMREKDQIELKREETFLHLSNRELKDENFELISKIRFNQLNEINLSGNSIIKIEPLNKMILPFLEYLNLSNNKIENIKPVANLKSKKLKEIFLHHNDIKDISPFEDSEFPKLEILRIECNKNLKKDEKYDIIKKKFKNQIIYEEYIFDKFNKDYDCKISQEDKSIDLSDKRKGDKIVKDLYLVFTNFSKNININKLILRNNQINDPSPLSRIPMTNLRELDLSMNNIKNLNFLDKMKLGHLKNLYLNDNKITNIYSLIKITSNDLEAITLKDNNLNVNNKITSEILKFFKSKEIEVDLNQKDDFYL